ncbi:putative zinc finger protein [Trypanosoma cruzi]|nr:putative zinc finger protein [Trypanosoma cruzi]
MKELAKGAAACFALLLQSSMLSVVKSWLETIERKLQDLFYAVVERHISPLLIQESLLTVLGRSPSGESTFDVNENYNIAVSIPKKLITLKYTMEEASVMVKIEIPSAFPLKPPAVTFESGKGCGVSTDKWRSWMLKMTVLLFGGSANVWECVTLFW